MCECSVASNSRGKDFELFWVLQTQGHRLTRALRPDALPPLAWVMIQAKQCAVVRHVSVHGQEQKQTRRSRRVHVCNAGHRRAMLEKNFKCLRF